MYKKLFKRIIDFFVALIGCVLMFPFLITITILLFVSNDGNPFFFQSRPGKHGKLFKIFKFKTMNDKTDENGELLPPIMRITKIGAIIRKYSLDEIPQLFNVLKGEMSLVGPRPLLKEYLPIYSKEHKQRHLVKPGITGWAQINGRNTLTWNEKFKFDIYYVNNLTFILDMKIIFRTIKKVLIKDGVNTNQETTMPYFTGEN